MEDQSFIGTMLACGLCLAMGLWYFIREGIIIWRTRQTHYCNRCGYKMEPYTLSISSGSGLLFECPECRAIWDGRNQNVREGTDT